MSDWVTAKILCDPEKTGSSMSAVALFFDPGQGHARHHHPDNEQFIYVVSGKGEMTIEFEEGTPTTQTIAAGSLVFIPKGAYHSTFCSGWEPIRILAIYNPPGPEATMRNSPEFRTVPAEQLPSRL